MCGNGKRNLGTFALILMAGSAFFALPCLAAQREAPVRQTVQEPHFQQVTPDHTPTYQRARLVNSNRENLIVINRSSNQNKNGLNLNLGELKPVDPYQEALQKDFYSHSRAKDLEKRLQRLGDISSSSGPQNGIGTKATGVGQRGAADKLGIGSSIEQTLGGIESGLPSIGGTGRATISCAEGDDKNSQSDSTSKQAGSAAAEAASGGAAGTAVGDTSTSKDPMLELLTEWQEYMSELAEDTNFIESDIVEGTFIDRERRRGANRNDDVDGTGDGNDNLGTAQAVASKAQASNRSVSHQISHGSGEKPGASGAPDHRVPVKKGGSAAGIVETDDTCGNSLVKVHLPKTGAAYDPAKEGIGADVQPK